MLHLAKILLAVALIFAAAPSVEAFITYNLAHSKQASGTTATTPVEMATSIATADRQHRPTQAICYPAAIAFALAAVITYRKQPNQKKPA
jgi:hypothetical protein